MSERDNGGPAFPVECSADHIDNSHQTGNRLFQQYGMTLRDYFAAKAMAGVLNMVAHGVHSAASSADGCAVEAYRLADAMLKARRQ